LPAVAGLVAGMGLLGAIVYEAFGMAFWLPGLPAALAWVGAAGVTNWVLHAQTKRDRAQLHRLFEYYLDRKIIDEMVRQNTLPKLGGENRVISVLFTDVANFTSFSEGMDPEVLTALVNDYFEGVCEAIEAEAGLVDNFVGDAVLALFGAAQEQPDHADRAVSAALAIDVFASHFSASQHSRGIDFGITRIGVHSGPAMVGNIGTRKRLIYGALGDVLNTGSRLEGLNKVTGTRICVSGDTVSQSRRHVFRPVGEFVVKGRHHATEVFAPLDPRANRPERLARYETAFAALRAGDPGAAAQFAELHREDPADPSVAFHLKRLEAGQSGSEIVMAEK
jgi:adenylate cyclase